MAIPPEMLVKVLAKSKSRGLLLAKLAFTSSAVSHEVKEIIKHNSKSKQALNEAAFNASWFRPKKFQYFLTRRLRGHKIITIKKPNSQGQLIFHTLFEDHEHVFLINPKKPPNEQIVGEVRFPGMVVDMRMNNGYMVVITRPKLVLQFSIMMWNIRDGFTREYLGGYECLDNVVYHLNHAGPLVTLFDKLSRTTHYFGRDSYKNEIHFNEIALFYNQCVRQTSNHTVAKMDIAVHNGYVIARSKTNIDQPYAEAKLLPALPGESLRHLEHLGDGLVLFKLEEPMYRRCRWFVVCLYFNAFPTIMYTAENLSDSMLVSPGVLWMRSDFEQDRIIMTADNFMGFIN